MLEAKLDQASILKKVSISHTRLALKAIADD
jgi:hypothetical protein